MAGSDAIGVCKSKPSPPSFFVEESVYTTLLLLPMMMMVDFHICRYSMHGICCQFLCSGGGAFKAAVGANMGAEEQSILWMHAGFLGGGVEEPVLLSPLALGLLRHSFGPCCCHQ